MTASEFKSEIKHLCGGYFFYGEEDYLKKYYLSEAKKRIVPDDDVFGLTELGRDNYTADTLMSSIESLPLMSEKKLIVLSDIDVDSMKEQDFEDLINILRILPQYEYNVLFMYQSAMNFDAGTQSRPSARLKALSEVLKTVRFDRESKPRLVSWAGRHFTSELIIAPAELVEMLIDRCGCDMFTLSSEISKLCAYVKENGRERLTAEDIKAVTAENREIAAFDFANAILDGDTDRAYSILNDYRLTKVSAESALAGISRTISDLCTVKALAESGADKKAVSSKMKIHEYKASLYLKSAMRTDAARLRKISEACYLADIKIKNSQLDKYMILDRLAADATVR